MPKPLKSKQKTLKPRLHIFCEGEKTEPNYLKGYIERMFPGTKLSPVRKTPKNTPVQLVEEAIEEKNKNPSGDHFWVVYDREAKNKYSDSLHAEARTKAKKHGIKIAFSNVCFEIWVLLHFQTSAAVYTNYADLYRRSKLKTHMKNYDKGTKRLFSENEITYARENAKALNKKTIESADPRWKAPHQWNPYTDVYKLLDAIDQFGHKYA
jgi:hypothetical protein